MFFLIYKTTNLINNKIYIGKHQTENINDSYLGSGINLKKAIKKHGLENFKKEILFIFDTEEEMNRKEKELINEDFISDENNYNLGIGGEGGPHFKGKKHTQEAIDKSNRTQEYIEKRKKTFKENFEKGINKSWNKGKKQTIEHNKKISEGCKGRIISEETKEKISLTLKAYYLNKKNNS